jgi:hypothetical protein
MYYRKNVISVLFNSVSPRLFIRQLLELVGTVAQLTYAKGKILMDLVTVRIKEQF